MPTYRVLINRRNFLLTIDGHRRLHGFYQTVFLEAPDPDAAEKEAIGLVEANQDLQTMVLNDRTDPPMLHIDRLEEIAASSRPAAQPTGRTYYPEKLWWQFWK
jgi:hypothetical protein